jgi:hypothetical protein
VIAGNDGSDIVASRLRASSISHACTRIDNELVGGKYQFGRPTAA